jgi:hypothetical protein
MTAPNSIPARLRALESNATTCPACATFPAGWRFGQIDLDASPGTSPDVLCCPRCGKLLAKFYAVDFDGDRQAINA